MTRSLALLALLTGCSISVTRPTQPTAPTSPAETTAPPVTTVTTVTSAPPFTSATTVTSALPGTFLAIDVFASVKVENEHRGGYARDLFGYPADFGHRCDTRAEVLLRDTLARPHVKEPGCTVVSGEWHSPYDGLVVLSAADLQIDHVVALKEAWDSGAWSWSPAKRHAFANDIVDPRTLRATSSASNQDKGDKDPSNWLPPSTADVCSYVGDWVTIKARWGLSTDQSEHGRIRNLLLGPCAGWRVDGFQAVAAALG